MSLAGGLSYLRPHQVLTCCSYTYCDASSLLVPRELRLRLSWHCVEIVDSVKGAGCLGNSHGTSPWCRVFGMRSRSKTIATCDWNVDLQSVAPRDWAASFKSLTPSDWAADLRSSRKCVFVCQRRFRPNTAPSSMSPRS